ncbi:MAG: glutaredoxin family protein [Planctomycetota bacterium]|nr:glutaredoxin family protein [Planctomycetota bacterium]
MSYPAAVLYTRDGCHVCDEAKAVLYAHGLSVTEVNIDEDKTAFDQFDHCVPVVEIDGRIRFRGRVNEVLLRRLISQF